MVEFFKFFINFTNKIRREQCTIFIKEKNIKLINLLVYVVIFQDRIYLEGFLIAINLIS